MIFDIALYWLAGMAVFGGISIKERSKEIYSDMFIAAVIGWIFWPLVLLAQALPDNND